MIDDLFLTSTLGNPDKEFLQYAYSKIDVPELKKREYSDIASNGRQRNAYHRDYTRVLYSSSFRCLQGKMQILGIQTDASFRNRLTHSLEVSQIARSIAEQVGAAIGSNAYTNNNDLYVIEAAALAHDIGHPAFGHCGEKVLDTLEEGLRFEGNAQNYRVLRTLEKKIPEHGGLNLTNRMLLSVNKYIVREDEQIAVDCRANKFMYADDYDFLMGVRRECGLENERTLDVQIIDVADEIAYAVHDLEDALSIGYFDVNELAYLLEDYLKNEPECMLVFKHCVKKADDTARRVLTGTVQEYSSIFRKELVSELTNVLINDIGVVDISEKCNLEHGTNVNKELGFSRYKALAKGLKKVTFECINRRDSVALYEQRGETVIKGLYGMFTDIQYNRNYNLLPPEYRPDTPEMLSRSVIDYIAGMMDTFAISLYEKHFGVKFDEIKYLSKRDFYK